MRIIRKVIHRMHTLVRPRRFERDLDEELSFHLEMQTRWHESQGLDRQSAHALAAREFGGAIRFREEVLDTRGLTWAQDITRDIRFALRSYRRAPGFTAVAVITLALGIGTTTAAFSIIDAVLIRPLAYEKPERIVTLTGRDSLGREIPSVSVPTFDDWRGQSRSFSAIALYGTARRAVITAGEAAHVETANVSPDFFRALGVQPALGRTLMPDDVTKGEPVVVVSHGFWARALGSPRTLPDAHSASAPTPIGSSVFCHRASSTPPVSTCSSRMRSAHRGAQPVGTTSTSTPSRGWPTGSRSNRPARRCGRSRRASTRHTPMTCTDVACR